MRWISVEHEGLTLIYDKESKEYYATQASIAKMLKVYHNDHFYQKMIREKPFIKGLVPASDRGRRHSNLYDMGAVLEVLKEYNKKKPSNTRKKNITLVENLFTTS